MARKVVHVAAAVILDSQGRVLLAKRPDDKHQGGLWEFPGGKVESDESVESALHRELAEELDIEVSLQRPLIKVPFHYPDKSVLLDIFIVSHVSGEAWGREGQEIAWVLPELLQQYQFPAANKPIVDALLLPDSIAITPEGDASAIYRAAEVAVAAGAQALMLRSQLSATQLSLLQQRLQNLCDQHGRLLIFNGDIEQANRLQVEALHLSSRRLKSLQNRQQFNGRWLGASCHTPEEIRSAVEKGVDYITLSPVKPTASHPEMEPLGWQCFKDWVGLSSVPVYALGGVSISDIKQVVDCGGQGVAAISAWQVG